MYVATMSLFYGNREYRRGDDVAGVGDGVLAAWIESGAAAYREDGSTAVHPKARLAGKKPGREGLAYPSQGAGKDLVGQVPEPEARGARPKPRKRAGKKDPS